MEQPTWIPHHPPPTTTVTTVPFIVEPINHEPPAANNFPNPTAVAATHPPYAEMIYKAIEALNEKDGSSKRAIGKYIEQVYRDLLPPAHSTLLTHHLKRLKTTGLLVMVKKSYKLPPPRSTVSPTPKPNHQPVFVALGLADEPPVKKPGRRGRPPGSKLPKRPGRPPKPKSLSGISNGLKRRPGRPPKFQSQPTVIPFAAPAPGEPAGLTTVPVGSPRPRGRPRKNVAAVPGVGATAPPAAPVVRPGRPPKLPIVGRPKNPIRRPVGRPKGATAAATLARKVANDDLRRKVEYFQSKVKESVDVLKPYFNHESPVTTIAAIQELEILATLDLKAPLRDATQKFPPQQQLQPEPEPQPQMYQQYLQIPPQP